MKARNVLPLKLTLDGVLLAVLVLLFNKRSISMSFHEIAGLAVLGGIALHLLLNARWVAQVTRRFLGTGMPIRVRIFWTVNALLLLCFLAIGLSGVLISKVVFSFGGGSIWKTVHYFASACALILMGVHLGLHAPLLAGLCRKHGCTALPLRIAGGVLALAVFTYGSYNLFTSDFSRWLTMPFTTQQLTQQGPDGEAGAFHGGGPGTGGGERIGQGQGSGMGKGQAPGQGGSASAGGSAIHTAATYFSMLFVFACFAAVFQWLCTRKPTPPSPTCKQLE